MPETRFHFLEAQRLTRLWHNRYRIVVRTINRKREQQGRMVDESEANDEDQTQTNKVEQTFPEIAAGKDRQQRICPKRGD
jgi:hypothetical protein